MLYVISGADARPLLSSTDLRNSNAAQPEQIYGYLDSNNNFEGSRESNPILSRPVP